MIGREERKRGMWVGDKTIFLERMEERKEERKWMCMKESEVEESREERQRTNDQGKRRKETKEKDVWIHTLLNIIHLNK